MYIRTIFGSIYKVDNNKYGVIEENGIFKKYCENMGHSWYSELVATKQSENLAELCDRYVGISNNKPMIIKYEFDEYYDEYGDTYTKEELLMEYDTIYGAIYTDKGLIYVARMNEIGELVLI